MKTDLDRAESLYKEQLMAKQDYELKQATYTAQLATVRESEARITQARAQREQQAASLTSMQRRIAQAKASLTMVADVLKKHSSFAPLDGVSHQPAGASGRIGGPGPSESSGTLIMTIADMSLITAEVKVDETDIVECQARAAVDLTIDAIPNKTFKGRVTEIGNTAILRSTGVAANQSAISSQEAKDFKVVVAPRQSARRGPPRTSCTAKITTATRQNVLSIPIQALTVRQKGDLEAKPEGSGSTAVAETKPTRPRKRQEGAYRCFRDPRRKGGVPESGHRDYRGY